MNNAGGSSIIGNGPTSQFTLRNGNVTDPTQNPNWLWKVGGGVQVFNSSGVTIQYCTITGNEGTQGGGVFFGSSPNSQLLNNNITSNTIDKTHVDALAGNSSIGVYGAGVDVYNSNNLKIQDNVIASNQAIGTPSAGAGPAGGGIFAAFGAVNIVHNQLYSNVGGEGGGGIFFGGYAAGTIADNNVYSNSAAMGGGMYFEYRSTETHTNPHSSYPAPASESTVVASNTITSNTAQWYSSGPWAGLAGNGGGVCVYGWSFVTFKNNEIASNTSQNAGGGVMIGEWSNCTFMGNSIHNNAAVTPGAGLGGGLFMDEALPIANKPLGRSADDYLTTAMLTGNTFDANSANSAGNLHYGGNILVQDSLANLTNNVISNGIAHTDPGIWVGSNTYATLQNNTIVKNDATGTGTLGGGLGIDPTVASCTVRNNIFALNGTTAGHLAYQILDFSPANKVRYDTNFVTDDGAGMLSGPGGVLHNAANMNSSTSLDADGNLSGSPGFVNAGNNDFRLATGSVCINAGVSTNAPLIDRGGRMRNSVLDIGAYEYFQYAPATCGIYDPATANWHLLNSDTDAYASVSYGVSPDTPFGYGAPGANWVPIMGNWDGAGSPGQNNYVTVGLYDPTYSWFHLRNSNTTGVADINVGFGSPNAYLPVVGDWNGDGTDTIGLYSPSSGWFILSNSNTSPSADVVFQFVPSGWASSWLPIAGDWDGNGTDTIGLYNPGNANFYLRNTNNNGAACVVTRENR